MVNHDDHRDAWIELGEAVNRLTEAIRAAAREDIERAARAARTFKRANKRQP